MDSMIIASIDDVDNNDINHQRFLREFKWFEEISEGLNTFLFERTLRSYQGQILSNRRFIVKSPVGKEDATCVATLYRPECYAYLFRNDFIDFWIFTDETTDAYGISSAFIPQINLFILSKSHSAGRVSSWINWVQESASHLESLSLDDEGQTSLVVGHANFAHFLWNQLPALIATEKFTNVNIDQVLVTHEPILPLDKLIDCIWDAPFIKTSTSAKTGLQANGGVYKGVMFSVGSTLVTENTKRRLRERCKTYSDDLSSLDFHKLGACLWVSLRLRDRHATNINECLISIFKNIEKSYSSFTIIIDGFSEPGDLDYQDRYNISSNTSQRFAIRNLSRDLFDRIEKEKFKNLKFYNISTFDTASAIAAARHADFYFCHHGTQQHKIGWIYDIPGIIHANHSIVESGPAYWVKFQCGSSHLPDYVPSEFIESVDIKNELQYNNSYYHDYRFINSDQLSEFVIEKIRNSNLSCINKLD